MKYCFIINPFAGKRGGTDELVLKIKEACEKENASYDIYVSKAVEETKAYINRESTIGEVTFVSCGGDGTLCNTVSAVMSLPQSARDRVSIGVMPIGTGNDFVSNFENKNLFHDITAQIHSTPYQIDLLKCNDLYSINMVNIGFDCHVVCKKEKMDSHKRVPRKLAYIAALVLTLIKKPGVQMKQICADGKEMSKKLLLTTFSNGAFCGGGFKSNPRAALDDGNIDCISIANVGRIKFLSLVGKYKKGLHITESLKHIVTHFKTEKVQLFFEQLTPVSVDGEIIRVKELNIAVLGKALTVMLPNGVTPSALLAGKAIPELISTT